MVNKKSFKTYNMITNLLLIPIIGSLLILIIDENSYKGAERIKKFGIFFALINFLISIIIWGEFDSSSLQYQFIQEYNHSIFCHFHVGIDGISIYFILLTTFITPICLLSNWYSIFTKVKTFVIAFLLIETLLIGVFVVLDLILFYIFFEAVLIPIFLVVGIYGSSSTRIRAAFLLFLYTLAGSLFILLAILDIYNKLGTTDYTLLYFGNIEFSHQKLLWLAFFLSFAVKTPLFPFHIWLPRAHAEAPLRGSVLLAGLFLKLATYGYLRILLNFIPEATSYFSPLIQTIAIITLIYSSLATIRQFDMKAIVAYSSISHMAIVILGLFSNTLVGIEGAILLSIAHGFISPALFILLGGVLYDRFHSRILRYYRGLRSRIPIFRLLFFIATICNIGVPLSLNWAGEFISLIGIFQQSPIIRIFASSSIVLSACYSIFLFNRISFGKLGNYTYLPSDINKREYIILLTLLFPRVLFGIIPNIILNDLHASVTQLLY